MAYKGTFCFIHGADKDKSMNRNLQWDKLVLYTFFGTHVVGISFFSSLVQRLEPGLTPSFVGPEVSLGFWRDVKIH